MARILITTWPLPGHLFPQISVALALRKRGHEVAFFTGPRGVRVAMDEGFRAFPFQSVDEQKLYDTLFRPERGSLELRGLLRFQGTLRRWLLDTIPSQVQDLEAIVAEFQPSILVSDPSMWAPILILRERLKIPVCISSFVPACMVPGPGAPPFGLGFPRPKDWKTRLAAYLLEVGTNLMTAKFRAAASDLRESYGLPRLTGSVAELTGTADLYLVPSAPEFDYERRELPPSVRYVGPCLWNRPRTEESGGWIQEIPRDLPWVHVTEGTVHHNRPFVLQAAAEGLANLPVRVIMTTGGDRDPKELGLGSLAPNIHVGRWVSHSDLLPLTDLVVTTGGAGTVLATLNAGVPLLLIPTEWDKPEIAQRVVEFGAGLRLAPSGCNAARIRDRVQKILGDPEYRSNAQRLAKIFSRYGGPDYAAELIEAAASQRNQRQ